MIDLCSYLSANSYPGRGIAIGKSADGSEAILIYFIMGRSANSRNRVFIENSDGSVRTKAFDESRLTDPSLIIYTPVRIFGNSTIVTNGDQTDTIYNSLKEGKTFADALRTRGYEPDEPNFTPRISGMATVQNGKFSYKLSLLKKSYKASSCDRFFYEYENTAAGVGHFIHTYKSDGNPIPSFEGEPVVFACDRDFEALADGVWNALNEENKVSLLVRSISIRDGSYQTKIYNKNK